PGGAYPTVGGIIAALSLTASRNDPHAPRAIVRPPQLGSARGAQPECHGGRHPGCATGKSSQAGFRGTQRARPGATGADHRPTRALTPATSASISSKAPPGSSSVALSIRAMTPGTTP